MGKHEQPTREVYRDYTTDHPADIYYITVQSGEPIPGERRGGWLIAGVFALGTLVVVAMTAISAIALGF